MNILSFTTLCKQRTVLALTSCSEEPDRHSSDIGLRRMTSDEFAGFLDHQVISYSEFAVMVVLVRNGDTVASWILDPIADQLCVSEKGLLVARNSEIWSIVRSTLIA